MNPSADEKYRLNLLLIEDDEDFRKSLVRRLKRQNYKITETATAEEGLEFLKKEDFDAVVSDIKLPKMDGVGFLRHAREIKSDIPVILLTGYASLESAKEAVHLKAVEYLFKPLEDINELTKPLEQAVENYRLQQENKKLTTALKEQINALEKSREKYRSLFEMAGDIIFTTDKEGNIININTRVKEVTGFAPNEIVGKPMKSILVSLEDDIQTIKFKQIMYGSSKKSVEVILISKEVNDGEIIAELSMRPIHVKNEVIGIHGILRDITERKKMEKELKKKVKELEERKEYFNQRENDVLLLKQEVNEYLKELGRYEKY